MATPERDEISGEDTTGHEWDGIKELNTPLPKWWVTTLYGCIIWAVIYSIVYPTWPMISGYSKGVLGWSSRNDVANAMAAADAGRKVFTDKIASLDLADINKDPELSRFAMAGGQSVFGDKCAACHGSAAQGSTGYPNLSDDDWLWGGTLDEIHTTIQHGIRAGDDDTRESDMPAFGNDDVLERAEIEQVADYVMSLSGKDDASAAGQEIFADNCAACHGDNGKGGRDVGAPNLTDAIWLYGGNRETIVETVTASRHGVMPAWSGQLDDVTIKQLALYVHSLGGGE